MMAADWIKAATGHNQAASLTVFLVEPWMPQIEPGIVRISMSKKITEDGNKSCRLLWVPKIPTSVKTDALTKLGLTSALYALVTVHLPGNRARTTFSNWNATAFYDESVDRFKFGGWEGFEVQLLFMEAI